MDYPRKGSGSFLKKRTKKLLLLLGVGVMSQTPKLQSHKVFLLLFLQKKKLTYSILS
jgi:hypothetical protein